MVVVFAVDETSDLDFYSEARLVYHVDDSARVALTKWYRTNLPQVALTSKVDVKLDWAYLELNQHHWSTVLWPTGFGRIRLRLVLELDHPLS